MRTYPIPISNGILEKKHREQIGSAIWLFLFLIDKSTKEQPAGDGSQIEGLVLGGMPITTEYISELTGDSQRTIRYHLDRLEEYGYIRKIVHPGSASGYAVRKSKKFFNKVRQVLVGPELDDETPPAGDQNPGKNLPDQDDEPRQEVAGGEASSCRGSGNNFPRNKEDIPKTLQRDTSKPSARKTREKPTDPRRALLIEDLKTYIEKKGYRFSFDGADGKNLDAWLKAHPDVAQEEWRRLINNRARVPDGKDDPRGINHGAAIRSWITRIHEYQQGPLDRFWQAWSTNSNKAGQQNGNSKSADIRNNLSEALSRRAARGVAGRETGDSAVGVSG